MSKLFGLFSTCAFVIAVLDVGASRMECLVASIVFALWAILFALWEQRS